MSLNKSNRSHRLKQISAALTSVKNDGLSIRQAAKIFSIPKSTLSDHYRSIEGGHQFCSQHPRVVNIRGRKPFFTNSEELEFVRYIKQLSSINNPLSKKTLISHAAQFAQKCGKCFKKDKPSKKWLQGLLSRHPDIAIYLTNLPTFPVEIQHYDDERNLHSSQTLKPMATACRDNTGFNSTSSFINLPFWENSSGVLERVTLPDYINSQPVILSITPVHSNSTHTVPVWDTTVCQPGQTLCAEGLWSKTDTSHSICHGSGIPTLPPIMSTRIQTSKFGKPS